MIHTLDTDPRWMRFHDDSWACPCCGETHSGIFDLSLAKPAYWQNTEGKYHNSEIASRQGEDVLTEDFCMIGGKYFFIRTVLQIPIIGSHKKFFGYGVWSSLSEENFKSYIDTFDEGEQEHLGPWFSWLSVEIKGYPDTLGMKTLIHPQNGRQRPLVELEPVDHPLYDEQKNGISFDRLLDIYALNGHDIRESLSIAN